MHSEVDALEEAILPVETHSDAQHWKAKVEIKFETKRYEVGTVHNSIDLEKAFQLRDEVFRETFPDLRVNLQQMDYLDPYADILYVRHKQSGEIIACYRLLHSQLSPAFYSAEEFEISEFLAEPGSKLELSRACVAAEHRNGIVLHLLWKGIASYMECTRSQYLFGLSSVNHKDTQDIFHLYQFLKTNGYIGENFEIIPRKGYKFVNWYTIMESFIDDGPETLPNNVPSLLHSYLRAGAKIYGAPAFDPYFHCTDLFTVLKYSDIAKGHSRKYLSQGA